MDAARIHTTRDKVCAIVEALPPTSKQSSQAFLGFLASYDWLLEQRATVIRDLYQLQQKEVAWAWEEWHRQAFENIRQLILQRTVLVHYDPDKPLVILCDASPYGFGAFLAHEDSWGLEAPIVFALCTLGPVELKYVQLDWEELAVVFAAQHSTSLLWAESVSHFQQQRRRRRFVAVGIRPRMGRNAHMQQTLNNKCLKTSGFARMGVSWAERALKGSFLLCP